MLVQYVQVSFIGVIYVCICVIVSLVYESYAKGP